LSTDNSIIQSIFPGLKEFPHCDVSVSTALAKSIVTNIEVGGVRAYIDAVITMQIHNASFSLQACTLEYKNTPLLSYTLQSFPNNNATATLRISNSSSSVTAVKTSIGRINTATIAQQADSIINSLHQQHSYLVGYTNNFQIYNLAHSFKTNFDLISMNVKIINL